MPFRVVQTEVWAGFPSQVVVAAADDVEVQLSTTGSVWLSGSAVTETTAGLQLGENETWCRFAVTSGDELWAYASQDATVTALIRSEAA